MAIENLQHEFTAAGNFFLEEEWIDNESVVFSEHLNGLQEIIGTIDELVKQVEDKANANEGEINNSVKKEDGKGLSSNDFTDEYIAQIQAAFPSEKIVFSTEDLVEGESELTAGSICFVYGIEDEEEEASFIVTTTPNYPEEYYSLTFISDASYDDINLIAKAISNNAEITNTTNTVYIENYNNSLYSLTLGDTREITLNNLTTSIRLIGFNHDSLDNVLAYEEITTTTKAGLTFELVNAFSATELNLSSTQMDSSNTVSWEGSLVRTNNIPVLETYLPVELFNIIKPVKKYTAQGGGTSYINTLVTTIDQLFLLSSAELGNANNASTEEGVVYQYYVNGNSRIKRDSSGTAVHYWTRSPYKGNGSGFNYVRSTNGNVITKPTGDVIVSNISFAFCI